MDKVELRTYPKILRRRHSEPLNGFAFRAKQSPTAAPGIPSSFYSSANVLVDFIKIGRRALGKGWPLAYYRKQ